MDQTPFTIPIGIDEIFLAMVGSKRAVGNVFCDYVEIPPGYKVQYVLPIVNTNPNYEIIVVPIEFTAVPDPDYSIAGKFVTDDVVVVDDPSMTSVIYSNPMNFLREYTLTIYAKNKLVAEFTNNSNDVASVNFRLVYIVMFKNDYDTLIRVYMERIKNWLLTQR